MRGPFRMILAASAPAAEIVTDFFKAMAFHTFKDSAFARQQEWRIYLELLESGLGFVRFVSRLSLACTRTNARAVVYL